MQVSGMELFYKAKTVRLKSHHDKYLKADRDGETVTQDRSGINPAARWTVEFVDGVDSVIRLKSCYGKYLTASDEEFLKMGITGQKVIQSLPRKLDSSVEWEPIRDGMLVKLKTRYGNYLRANGGLPPWRNSITHDIPHRHHDWILWDVHVVEIRADEAPPIVDDDDDDDFHLPAPSRSLSGSHDIASMKSFGRRIYYNVVNDDGEIEDKDEHSFEFKGHGLDELTQKLEEETGLENVTVCSQNVLTGNLYPLRLALPPNNATIHVVVVPSTSKAASEL